MNKRLSISLILILLLIAGRESAKGQLIKRAQVGFRFLENPVGAEVIGRGMVGVATTRNSNGIFWNPGLLGWIQSDVDLSLNNTQGIADINMNSAAAAVTLRGIGVIGVSLLVMDYGEFYGTRRANNEQGYEETGMFSPKAYAVGMAFSQKVSDRFSYGVHLKYARQDLGSAWVAPTGSSLGDPNLTVAQRGYAQNALAADVGAYYDFQYNGIKFGATLQNISREVRYESEPFPLPFAVSFGATVEPLRFFVDDQTNPLVLSFESRHPRDFDEKLKLGAEYHLVETVIARIGYSTNYDERGLSAGLGIRYEVAGFPLRADYAYQAFGLFGAVHHLSIGISY